MSKTTDYIVEDDSMTLPQEVRQRVLADGFDTEEDAVEEMNYIIDDYVDAHG